MHLEFKFFYKEDHTEIDLQNPKYILEKYIYDNFFIPHNIHWAIKPEGGLFIYETDSAENSFIDIPEGIVDVEVNLVREVSETPGE
jgi:hypothetical protein